jgi:hypothetical protein
MANVLTVTDVTDTGKEILVRGTMVVSGNYLAGGGNGEAINFGAAGGKQIPSSKVPKAGSVRFTPRTSGLNLGYIPGATRDAGKVRFFTTANTELTGAPTAFPAYATGDTFDWEAAFEKLV